MEEQREGWGNPHEDYSLTEDTIVARGARARQLLDHPAFLETIRDLQGAWEAEAFYATKPEDRERREQLYYQHIALQAIHAALVARANEALAILEEREANGEAWED